MTRRLFDTAWYRFGATFRPRWPGYLAMASIAGARRTQSAFPAYLRATDASDLQFQSSSQSNVYNVFSSTDPLLKRLARLPHVAHVASGPYFLVIPAGSNGKPTPTEAGVSATVQSSATVLRPRSYGSACQRRFDDVHWFHANISFAR